MLGWIARLTRNRLTGSGLVADAYRQAGLPVASDDRTVTPADLAREIQPTAAKINADTKEH